jgi:hypothetical protein
MDRDGGRTVPPRTRRRWLWILAATIGLAVSHPAVAGSQPVHTGVAAQLNPFRGVICEILQSLNAAFAPFPAATAVLASIAESLGCSGGTAPGTTTSTSVVGTTSTTIGTGTTTTTIGPGATTTFTTIGGPTSSITITPTTLGPCGTTTTLMGTVVPTTIPCTSTG